MAFEMKLTPFVKTRFLRRLYDDNRSAALWYIQYGWMLAK